MSLIHDSSPDALLDRKCIEEIRFIERKVGRNDLFASFVQTLERNLAAFRSAFGDLVARGDTAGAARAAHTRKGACGQLGAQALGALFAEIECSAKAGDYAEAERKFAGSAGLIQRSLEALKQA